MIVSSSMANAPVAPIKIASREPNVIPVPDDHEASIDICVENMEPSSGATEITGRNKISLGEMSAPSPFIITINLPVDHHTDPGNTSSFVSNVPAETVINDGSLDDPEWVKVIAGEIAEGIEGTTNRIGPRLYGK